MSGNYKRMMEVLQRWPIDKTKGKRDYGLYLRTITKAAFPVGEIFEGTEEEKNAKYNSLLRLADNKYGKLYSKLRTTAATGLTKDQLNEALSQEFVDNYLK